MARIVGKAGQYARKLESGRRLRRLVVMVLCLAAGYVLYRCAGGVVSHRLGGTLALVLVGAILGGYKIIGEAATAADKRYRKSAGQAARGAEAEEFIGKALARLPDDHVVVHDVDTGRGNIDHVVIAPHGVYAIETKSHRGRVWGDEKLYHNRRPFPKDPLAQTARHVRWLRERLQQGAGLEVPVQGLLVFTEATLGNPLPTRPDVLVLTADRLHEVFDRRPGHLLGEARVAVPVERVLAAITSGKGAGRQKT